jgi:hypothetical protein
VIVEDHHKIMHHALHHFDRRRSLLLKPSPERQLKPEWKENLSTDLLAGGRVSLLGEGESAVHG